MLRMLRAPILSTIPLLCLTTGCADSSATPSPSDETSDSGGTGDTSEAAATYTWHRDVEAIVAQKCAGCHVEGDIAPFPLTNYAEVSGLAAILAPAIDSRTMPPWPPAAGCNEYEHDRSLSDEQREVLLTWIAEGTPEGDPADAPAPTEPPPAYVPDAMLEMPESYTPTMEPDDYRCFLIDGPELDQTNYLTGFEVYPGERAIVHHVIGFLAGPDSVADFEAFDDADPGAGYTCFGGPTGAGSSVTGLAGVRWVGSWVPGSEPWTAPEGTGIRIEPGSKLILQMHYNTSSSAPISDRTSVGLTLTDTVEHPAMMLPFTNFGWVTGADPMTIPAGEPAVTHSFTAGRDAPLLTTLLGEIGATPEDTLQIRNAGLHMHLLGRKASLAIEHGDGGESCLLRIDDYDFGWQGGYGLREAVEFGPNDSLTLGCEWDNSAGNQPIIDGEIGEPKDVEWGDGSFDEMCLSVIYVSQ